MLVCVCGMVPRYFVDVMVGWAETIGPSDYMAGAFCVVPIYTVGTVPCNLLLKYISPWQI